MEERGNGWKVHQHCYTGKYRDDDGAEADPYAYSDRSQPKVLKGKNFCVLC